MSYVLGVDLGTTAIKAALFDKDGAEVVSHTEEYSLITAKPGHVELEAQTYIDTFRNAVRAVLSGSDRDISVLGLSAQGETLLCLGEDGDPIRNVIVWMDNRATAEAQEIEDHFGRDTIHATTGQVAMDPIWPASKLLWLKRHEPETFSRAARFALLKDYILLRLTGRLISEDSLLCTTILWDIRSRGYWPEMLQYLGVEEQQLPEIARQGEIVGQVAEAGSRDLGVPVGIPVSVGALDQACGALGIGNAVPGIFSESTGSALTSVTLVNELTLDPHAQVPCFPSAIAGQYMLHNFSTGGMVMRWYRDEFCRAESEIEELCGVNAYWLIDQEVASVPPGSEGLIVLPHLQGAGPPDLDPFAKGVIFGITLAHGKAHLSRGIMEGVTMVLKRMIDATAKLGVEVEQIISLSGGSKSDVWCQIKADATQVPVHTLRSADAAACRGAAIIAGAHGDVWESVESAAARELVFERTFQPRPEYAAVYAQLFDRFVALQEMAGTFARRT